MVLEDPIMYNIFLGIIIFIGLITICQNLGNCINTNEQRLENTSITDTSLNNCFVIEENLEIGIVNKDNNIDNIDNIDINDNNEHNLPSYSEIFK